MNQGTLMYIHTALRNIGLFTSLSIVASNTTQRYMANVFQKTFAFIVAMLLLCVAIGLTHTYSNGVVEVNRKNVDDAAECADDDELVVWSRTIPYAIYAIHGSLACLLLTNLFGR